MDTLGPQRHAACSRPVRNRPRAAVWVVRRAASEGAAAAAIVAAEMQRRRAVSCTVLLERCGPASRSSGAMAVGTLDPSDAGRGATRKVQGSWAKEEAGGW